VGKESINFSSPSSVLLSLGMLVGTAVFFADNQPVNAQIVSEEALQNSTNAQLLEFGKSQNNRRVGILAYCIPIGNCDSEAWNALPLQSIQANFSLLCVETQYRSQIGEWQDSEFIRQVCVLSENVLSSEANFGLW
jgi:hypothetical protein